MRAKKKVSVEAKPFLETAAEAIGTALGRLAVKTGVAHTAVPAPKKQTPIGKKKLVKRSAQKKSRAPKSPRTAETKR